MEAASPRRREERVPTELPVRLDEGASGVAKNVSASGVFFETSGDHAPGSEISFVIELDGPEGKLELNCKGRIVRVEQRDGKVGVAAKIIDSNMRLMDQ